MASLEEELLYASTSTAPNQLILTGDVTAEFVDSIQKELNVDLKLEPKDAQDATDNQKDKKKRVDCPECTKSFYDEEKLVCHIRKIHRGEHPYQCTMCQYTTQHKASFEEHVRVHQGIKPFKCQYCDYRSASKKNAKNHEQTVHNPSNQKLICAECGVKCRKQSSLKEHMLSHVKHKQCKHCGSKFENSKKLRYHQKTYVKKCEKCPAKVCSKELKIKHMAEVHKEYYYQEAGQEYRQRKQKVKPAIWICKICQWESHSLQKTLLHLIHHPNQEVDDDIDVTPLRKYNILP